jgi:hypothetical protein
MSNFLFKKPFTLLSTVVLTASPLVGCGGDPMELEAEAALELATTEQSISYNGSDYLFITSPRSWQDARSYCQQYGYDLVTINNSTEEAFLETEERNRGLYNWWIGYNDRSLEGQWSWTFSTSTYTNWYPGEPNDFAGNEDCTTDRYRTDSGNIVSEQWNDDDCSKPYNFICERPLNQGSFSYSAVNTSNATVNTTDRVIYLTAGQTFTMGTCGVEGASGSGDTFLKLMNPSGQEVAVNDDASGSCVTLSTITYTVAVTGWHTMRAGCFSNTSCSGTVAYIF